MSRTLKLLVACMLVVAGGCSSLSDHHYEKTQRARAREAWRHHGAKCKQQVCEKDYAAGWKDGFYDIATGGKGCPPVVAPCKYWDPAQILEDHDQRRLAYYNGFQDGVACSLQYPQTHYLKLWSSCECPLPACETQCAPCSPTLPQPCGLVVEGAEFMIEDDFHDGDSVPSPRPVPSMPQRLQPVEAPRLDVPEAIAPPKPIENEDLGPGASGTNVRYSQPIHLDDLGLAVPGFFSAGYRFAP